MFEQDFSPDRKSSEQLMPVIHHLCQDTHASKLAISLHSPRIDLDSVVKK